MDPFFSFMTGVFDKLNPYNEANLILYFSWLVLFAFTTVAIWRSRRGWFRLLCYLLNQVFGIGVILSYSLVVVIAYRYWHASLAALAATVVLSLWFFRTRRGADPSVNQEAAT